MKSAFLLALVLISSEAVGQGKTFFEAELGAAVPMHKDLSSAFDLGLTMNVGIGINLYNEKLYIRPGGGVKWYFKEVENVNSVTEHLRTWKGGLEVRYYVHKKGDWLLAPYISVDYNASNNYYSASSYNPFNNQTTSATSSDYLEGKGISVALGLILNVERTYFKLNYEFYNPSLNVNPEVVAAAYQEGIIIEPNQTMNLSSLTLSVGYTFPLAK